MKVADVNISLNHNIVGGSEYHWNCYGPNVRFLDYESIHAYASILFDTENQTVYEATVNSKDDEVSPYRWLNPNTKENYFNECKVKNIDPHEAWDDVKWVDLEVEEDFLTKAKCIFENKAFDTRVTVPLDLDDSTILSLALEAHKRDITINQMVELLLKELIESHKNQVNGK